MSGSAKSVCYFGIYIVLLGILLVFFPNPLLRLVNVAATGEVWIHLAGMLLIFMGFFYFMAGRTGLLPFFRWTLVTRSAAAVFVTGFVLAGLISPVIILFWLGDLAGALWTFFALRREGALGKRKGQRMRNDPWAGKIAVVTGASSGIGAATARRLARQGLQVVLVARRLDRLQTLRDEIRQAGGQAHILEADLAQESDRASVYKEVESRFGNIDVLVNNAGLGWYGYGDEMPWKTAWEMLQVNVEAVVQLSLPFLARMRLRNTGHIINVGSISGSIPSQGIALYGATKSFLDNFTTALYRELMGSRVHVSVVRAGPVRTEFGEAALAQERGGHVPTEHVGVTADFVAWKIWKLLLRPRRVIYVPGWLRVVPWAELSFGWIIDRVGPLLLKKGKNGV